MVLWGNNYPTMIDDPPHRADTATLGELSAPTWGNMMIIEPIESMFDMPALDCAFFDGKPGLDAETKAILMALFHALHKDEIIIPDYYGDLQDDEEV